MAAHSRSKNLCRAPSKFPNFKITCVYSLLCFQTFVLGHQLSAAHIPIGYWIFDLLSAKPNLLEEDGLPVECYLENELNRSLKNWGENVNFHPRFIFIPKTKKGVCNIVQWAAAQNLRIRVGGYRHTWNPVYADTGQIFISLLGLKHVNSHLSASADGYNTGAGQEFRTIEYVPGCPESDKIFCKVGGAVTYDELRAFCLKTQDPISHNYWSIPSSVILVENTLSGTISSICHGAGSQHKTLSDLVEEIEFVNAKGEIQVINKKRQPELMQAAAGSFGLLGIITSMTLKLDKLGYALMDPKFVNLLEAIPPPLGTQVDQMPKRLVDELNISSQEILDINISQNTEMFFNRCRDYYAEWFWFILNGKCWVNTWNKDDPINDQNNQYQWENEGGKAYFDLKAWFDNGIASFSKNFNNQALMMPPPPFQEKFVRSANGLITGFLHSRPQTLPLPEALHFQRGIRHTQVRDVEIEIPIPLKENGEPDWSICQKAWWDAIYVIYRRLENTETLPINLTLEMRIMNGSDITMAAQKGNAFTCCIEVLSTLLVPYGEWKSAVEEIIAAWVSYKDKDNNPLLIRTHWAKEWTGLNFAGKNANDFVRDSYLEEIPKFKQKLSDIALIGGYTLNDMQNRFSNELWDAVIFREKGEMSSP